MSTKRTLYAVAGVVCLAVGVWLIGAAVAARSSSVGSEVAALVVRWLVGLVLVVAAVAFGWAATRHDPERLTFGGVASRAHWRHWREAADDLSESSRCVRSWISAGRLRPSPKLRTTLGESRKVVASYETAAARRRAPQVQELARRATKLRERVVYLADIDARRTGWFVDTDDEGNIELRWAQGYVKPATDRGAG